MNRRPPAPGRDPAPGIHVATIAHDGRLWDAYLDFADDVHQPTSFRARLRFEPPAGDDTLPSAQTTVIIIEDSYEEAVARARSFDDRQLESLLRSALPDDKTADA
jgi:hypothetical protein